LYDFRVIGAETWSAQRHILVEHCLISPLIEQADHRGIDLPIQLTVALQVSFVRCIPHSPWPLQSAAPALRTAAFALQLEKPFERPIGVGYTLNAISKAPMLSCSKSSFGGRLMQFRDTFA